MMVLIDPKTRTPLGPIDGSPPRLYHNASGWAIERDEDGIPVRMRWIEKPETDQPEPKA